MLAVLILSGCGGSGQSKEQWQHVDGGTFSFRAPAGWHVTVTKTRTTARDGDAFVQVASFRLVRAYTDALFRKVRGELDLRMAAVARQVGGSVASHRVVTVDRTPSHQYDVRVGKRTDRYTFVLRGRRELLLLCSARADVCDELAASFVAG